MPGEPLTKGKEIDTTAYNLDDFRRHPGFLSSDVRSAVEGFCNELDLIIHDGHEPIIKNLKNIWFPVFKEEK